MSTKLEYANLLLWNKWDMTHVKVEDQGLSSVIDLRPTLIPHSGGRHEHQKFSKTKVNVVETAGQPADALRQEARQEHRQDGRQEAKVAEHRQDRVRDNPPQDRAATPSRYLVKAIENSAPNEDTTRMSYGGVVYHISVDISPTRRIDLALRFISEGVREATFRNTRTVEEVLADEIIAAAAGDSNTFAVKRKNEQERIAMASR